MARAIAKRHAKQISTEEMYLSGPAAGWDEEHLAALRAFPGDHSEWFDEYAAWQQAGSPPLEQWQELKMAKGIDPCGWPKRGTAP